MRNLFLILVAFFSLNISLACDHLDDASENIDVNTWLGDRSKFSKAFKNRDKTKNACRWDLEKEA